MHRGLRDDGEFNEGDASGDDGSATLRGESFRESTDPSNELAADEGGVCHRRAGPSRRGDRRYFRTTTALAMTSSAERTETRRHLFALLTDSCNSEPSLDHLSTDE